VTAKAAPLDATVALPPPLSVGLVLDSARIPAWAALVVDRLLAMKCLDVSIVRAEPTGPTEAVRREQKGESTFALGSRATWSAYTAFDRWVSACAGDEAPAAERLVGLAPRLAGVPVHSDVLGSRASSRASAVRPLGPPPFDVIVALHRAAPTIAASARYGLWTYDFLTEPVGDESEWGTLEVLEGRPVTECRILMITASAQPGSCEPPAAKVITVAHYATHRASMNRNRNDALWLATGLLPEKLRELHSTGIESVLARARAEAARSGADEGPRSSGRSRASAFSHRGLKREHLLRSARAALERLLFRQQWVLLWERSAAHADPPYGPVSTRLPENELTPPMDRYWADPHLARREGSGFVFFEEYLAAENRGRIVALPYPSAAVRDVRSSLGGGPFPRPLTIMDEGTHLSYPHMFEWEGQLYMIPETRAKGRIELYRCVEFPGRWELARTLLDGILAAESTVVVHAGRCWLFASVSPVPWEPANDYLHLFFCDDPIGGTWISHRQNPVVCDVRRSRPAGPIYSHQGRLFRPSQDCSGRYGSGIRINEIVRLSVEDYEESERAVIRPDRQRGFVATHTISSSGELLFMDAMRLVPRLRWPVVSRTCSASALSVDPMRPGARDCRLVGQPAGLVRRESQ